MDSTEKDTEGKKHSVSDSVPSSSTDADLKPNNSESTNEDAISSTSAELESSKLLYPDVNQFAAGLSAQDINLIIMGQPASTVEKKSSPSTADSDFLELNMPGTITEKITEDVEDIVQDLENLLGESTESFSVPKNKKTFESTSKEKTTSALNVMADPFTIFENQLAEKERQNLLKSSNEAFCSLEDDSSNSVKAAEVDVTSKSVEIDTQSSQIDENFDVEITEPVEGLETSACEVNVPTDTDNNSAEKGSVDQVSVHDDGVSNTNLLHCEDSEQTDNSQLECDQYENTENIGITNIELESNSANIEPPKCNTVMEVAPNQDENDTLQKSNNYATPENENSQKEELNLTASDIVSTNVDEKEETDYQSECSPQVTNYIDNETKTTENEEPEVEHSSDVAEEDVNVDTIKQHECEENVMEDENEDVSVNQTDVELFVNDTEITSKETVDEDKYQQDYKITDLVTSQIDNVDSNLPTDKMDVDEVDEAASPKENTEEPQDESKSDYINVPESTDIIMEIDLPSGSGTNNNQTCREEIEENLFDDLSAVPSKDNLETIEKIVEDPHGNVFENIQESDVISNEIEEPNLIETENVQKTVSDQAFDKDETDSVESTEMVQDEPVSNNEENTEVETVVGELFQITTPVTQTDVGDSNIQEEEEEEEAEVLGVVVQTAEVKESSVAEECSVSQFETEKGVNDDDTYMQDSLEVISDSVNNQEQISESVSNDDHNVMQMSSTTPEESCNDIQEIVTPSEENEIEDIDEDVHKAAQISEINSASDNTQVEQTEKELIPLAGPSADEINEEEIPTEMDKPLNKLTLEAVESIINYEFEENFISSSDGGKSYSNATQESMPYEIQENVPVSSSGSNYIESSSSSFYENAEDVPKETNEREINVENISHADSAEKSDEQSSDDVESSTEKEVLPEETEQKISIRIKTTQAGRSDVKTPLLISIDSVETVSESNSLAEESIQKSTVEKEENRCSLKMTITKQADSTHSILKIFNPNENVLEENIEGESKPCEQSVPKLIIKPVQKPADLDQPTVPKITIKPIQPPPECSLSHLKMPESNVDVNNPLKMTIRSPAKCEQNVSPKLNIKPLTKPESHETGHHSPRITIKPIVKSHDEVEQVHSPRLTIKPIVKPVEESKMVDLEKFGTKLTIKPLVKPRDEAELETTHSPRLTIKPVIKPHEESKSHVEQVHSPRLTIKPIIKPTDEAPKVEQHSPRITIKPVVKPDLNEPVHSPKITIKPILRPEEIEVTPTPKITIKPIVRSESEQSSHSPRITIKPPVKPPNPVEIIEIQDDDMEVDNRSESSPKITIKPIVKPPSEREIETIDLVDYEDEIKQERIVLKINKNTIPGSRENPKRQEDAGSEKLGKLRVKFSREGRRAHIVTPRNVLLKRSLPSSSEHETQKRLRSEQSTSQQSGREHLQSKLKQILSSSFIGHISGEQMPGEFQVTKDKPATTVGGMEISVVEKPYIEERDPLAEIPIFEISPDTIATMCKPPVVDLTSDNASESSMDTTVPVVPPPPRKRGRPRKVPLVVREEFKDPKEEIVPQPQPEPQQEHYDSGRPKRSCRGPSVRMTLGIKPRKPRGPGRGRGGKRGMGTRTIPMKPVKEPKLSAAKLKLLKALKDSEKETEVKDVIEEKEPDTPEVVIYEEETRMSADSSSRAQTPAKQVISSSVEIEESQSSFQSSATTESVKVRKGPRLEVHQEPEGAVISAEQLAEYSWGGGGPYMLQEQVAQFLGIKSFKRKYPGIKRRPLEMQERDFIRESGLASEAMCDLGLTAVNSADILDIMYSDFQNKYEEYCKHQRDRQAKDLTNKQKALSLAAKQENNKLDITEQAIQSAASWNSTFNKARREERKAFIDLQTFTIQYPKGKIKQINKDKVGNYPVALVPGQFTDWYKTFTPTELNNLPLNTMCYDAININNNIVPQDMDDSQSDCSMSDSDSSSSDSDSSDSGSSEDCNMCSPTPVLKHVTAV